MQNCLKPWDKQYLAGVEAICPHHLSIASAQSIAALHTPPGQVSGNFPVSWIACKERSARVSSMNTNAS